MNKINARYKRKQDNSNSFMCKCGCGESYTTKELEDLFEAIADEGYDVDIIEAYRCRNSNSSKGKIYNSAHTSGEAALIYCPIDIEIDEFVDMCENLGAKHITVIDDFEGIVYIDVSMKDTGEYFEGEGL